MGTFALKRGVEVETELVSAFLVEAARNAARDRFEAEHGEVEAPVYEVNTVGGDVERYRHDAESIKEAGEEEQADWARYQDLKARLERALRRTVISVYVYEGIKAEPPDGWEERQKRWGIAIPEDPIERKLHWVQTELVADPLELMALVAHIQGQKDPVEVAAANAASTFQRPLEGPGRAPDRRAADQEGRLVVQP